MRKLLFNLSIVVVMLLSSLFFLKGLNSSANFSQNHNLLADVTVTRTCHTCKGSGVEKITIRKKCYDCPNGYEEKVVERTCTTCNGTGKVTIKHQR